MPKVLTDEQFDRFMEVGWTRVEEAFPRKKALECQDFLWSRLENYGVYRDPHSWTEPMVHMMENFTAPVFDGVQTARMTGAIEDLIGKGRWRYADSTVPWGWWPINFHSGRGRLWDIPREGWHFDGNWFRHYMDSWEQGLLVLCLFSDVGTHGGGTLVAEGSHRVVGEVLAAHPDGLENDEAIQFINKTHPWFSELTGTSADGDRVPERLEPARTERLADVHTDSKGRNLRVVETTGAAGDIIICHPWLYHAASPNHSGKPRFMCNKNTPLKERMKFDRANLADLSPLERSIKTILSANSLTNR